jgi:exoribonuclease R
MYQLYVDLRNYSSWRVHRVDTNKPIDEPWTTQFRPFEHKMFSKDIFDMDFETVPTPTTLTPIVKYSPAQNVKDIAGILQIDGNKTYGRTDNKKKLLYKFIPDDKHLPPFLVPYEVVMGFSKVHKNKYAIIKFDVWRDKHPRGILLETIGDVGNLDSFYEYQLHCKSLHESISDITNKTRENLSRKSSDEFIHQMMNNPQFKIDDRRKTHRIISIDPEGSVDFDDAFSLQILENGEIQVSVYIANVYFWLETMGLWKSFSKRVSTIYLPDRKRPMLPTILSDTLCSLQKDQDRFAFVMDIKIDSRGRLIENSVSFATAIVRVCKNYVYEDPKMLETDSTYKPLADATMKLDTSTKDSHDVVAYWMIAINRICGDYMANNQFGVFRSAIYINKNKASELDESLTVETRKVISMWNNVSGQYMLFNELTDHGHEVMNLKSYVHISSPIRRLIDLLNQMLIFKHMNLVVNMSEDATAFLDDWLDKLEYINMSMRSIRKVQTDCELVHRCFSNPEIMQNIHNGVVFDKVAKGDGDAYSYMVYLEDIKLLSRITSRIDIENYSLHPFKLYLFEDEDKIQRKIRLHMMDILEK